MFQAVQRSGRKYIYSSTVLYKYLYVTWVLTIFPLKILSGWLLFLKCIFTLWYFYFDFLILSPPLVQRSNYFKCIWAVLYNNLWPYLVTGIPVSQRNVHLLQYRQYHRKYVKLLITFNTMSASTLFHTWQRPKSRMTDKLRGLFLVGIDVSHTDIKMALLHLPF